MVLSTAANITIILLKTMQKLLISSISKENQKFNNRTQNLRYPRSANLPDGHSYAMWPLPPQLWQMVMGPMQSLLMWPA